MIELQRGSITETDDLDIQVVDSGSSPVDPHTITYALFDVTTGVEVLIGPSERLPVRLELGTYYAHFQVPENAAYGLYRLRWRIKELSSSPEVVVIQEFRIVAASQIQSQLWTGTQADMLRRMRILTRDQNPDKFYHFRPPTSSGTLNEFNRVFAHIWEDEELLEYMEQAMFAINASPPETHFGSIDQMVAGKRDWIPWILTGAMVHACVALTLNWIADEFSYSVGGISLDIEKSSKYESMKNNAEGRFDKFMENKTRTVKIMRGLQQSRYGLGIRGRLGDPGGSGVVTPAKFIGV